MTRGIAALCVLFLLIILLFSIPGVQTFLGARVAQYLNDRYGVSIQVNRIGITFLGDLDVQEVLILDHRQDTLLYANSLQSSLLSFSELSKGSPRFGDVVVDSLQMHMKIYKGEDLDNLSVFSRKFAPKKKKEREFLLTATNIHVLNGVYSYANENLSTPEIIDFYDVYIDADNLRVENADLFFDARKIAFESKRGLKVKNLHTSFSRTQTAMGFKDLSIETAYSRLEGDVEFHYDLGDFLDFNNKVKIQANFRESVVNTNDLLPFYNKFGKGYTIDLKHTDFQGVLNDFTLFRTRVSGLDATRINGDIRIKNAFVPGAEGFELTGDLTNSSTTYYDLINLLPSVLAPSIPKYLYKFGTVTTSGSIIVTRNSIDVDATVKSLLGEASAFLILDNITNAEEATYNGNIIATNFDLGKLIDRKLVGKTNFDLDMDGQGFTFDALDTNLEGTISSLEFNSYTYSRIRVLGELKNSVFDGKLISKDPNLQLEFNGVADVSEQVNNYDFQANVGYIDFHALNFLKRDSISDFSGDVVMKMQGTSINNVSGTLLFSETSYRNENDRYYFDDFEITSTFSQDSIRTLTFDGPDIINGKIVGIYKFEDTYDLFINSLGNIYTNFQPRTVTANQFMEFDFKIYDKIVEVLYPDIKLGPNTSIKGRVESDESEFKLAFTSPHIQLFENYFENINLQVDNKNPLFNTYVSIDSIDTKMYDVSKFSLINVTQRDTLFMRSEFKGGKNNKDVYNLGFFHTINKEQQSVVGIRKSTIEFRENEWFINQNDNVHNKVVFTDGLKSFRIDSIVMKQGNERIQLHGNVRDSTEKNIKADFRNVSLAKALPEIDSLDLAGRLNGTISVLQNKGKYFPTSKMRVDSLRVNDILFGNLNMNIEGDEALTTFAVSSQLENGNATPLDASGYIFNRGNIPTLDLDVKMDAMDISGFSPLGGIVLSDIRGLVSGRAKLTGSYKNPEMNGLLYLFRAGFNVPYLNTDFAFNDRSKVVLEGQKFKFSSIKVKDTKYKTEGVLGGFIQHKNFKEWELGLDIDTDRLLVLDTKADEDALYYGTAFIDGEATIKGPTSQLVIDVTGTTESGTLFNIPLSDAESFGDLSYVHFVSPEEKRARLEGKEIEIQDVKGLELNFDLDVNNKAEVEIIVDKESGSSLRGRGAGTLLIQINTNGKFNMWGDFLVYEGLYNFRYGAFLEKKFSVRPGGSINWDGNPAAAILDLSAVYQTQANPAILLENPSFNRKIPVEVVVDLNGELLQPDLTFEIEFPNTSSVVKSELQYRLGNRTTRELQAISLVTQGQFYTDFAIGQNALAGNLVERASSLVNDIFSDEDDKFQVGLDYVQGDRTPDLTTADRFGVSLSTQISDRILLNGKVGVPIGGVSESVIVGDVQVDFLLNEARTLKASIFNRQNDIQYITGERQGYSQGVGLSYTYDFNTFRELIRTIFAKERKKKNLQENKAVPENQKDSIAVPDYVNFRSKNTKQSQ